MSTFSLYYHPLYSDGLDRTARFPVDRYRLLAEKISLLNRENQIRIREPRLASRDELLLVHEESFIDRFLVTAEAYHIPVTLLFNKIDLYNAE